MASFIDNFKINTAITDNTKLDLGHQHITTTNFMQLQPVLCKEMVPGERCDVNLMTFAKLQPLTVPTFGRANIKERAFFVPMRTIFRGWNDFITDTPHIYSGYDTPTKLSGDIEEIGSSVNYPRVPTVSNLALATLFLTTNYLLTGTRYFVATDVTSSQGGSNPLPYDILGYFNGGPKYMRLTTEGKQVLKVLESLGYKIVFDDRNKDVYSALPLLAVAKIYCDWYFPSQYVGTGVYADIMGLLNYDGSSAAHITTANLADIMAWISYVNFDSDYFVNAWDNPVSPVSGVYSQFTIYDISTSNSGASTDNDYLWGSTAPGTRIRNFGVSNDVNIVTNGTPVATTEFRNSTSPYNYMNRVGQSVSDYQHKALTALTDYMKRHQLVGARAMDRYLARFGKKLNAEQLNRSNYIGSKMVPMQIGDVYSNTSMSPTGTNYGLGQFAGKGMAFEKNFNFDWSTDEYGFLIVMSSVVPAAGVYQGIDRKIMHIGRLDYWTPEFDNLGVQAISTRELYNNYTYTNLSNSGSSYMSVDDTIFGFAPRYAEYKFANDQLTGDFVVRSLNNNNSNASDNSWHLMRTFDDEDFYDYSTSTYSFSNLVHSRNFMQGLRDHLQFDRIFNYTEEVYTPDPITMIYDFQMVSFAPMKPLYETYEFEDKGKKVEEEQGGVKVN